MDSIKVTLIIPVNNEEKYLPKALDSAVFQELKELEIICVDDGSTDYTQRILELYAMKYQNIRIINTDNIGIGASINTALMLARGEYIFILYAKDILELDALKNMYNLAIENRSDLVFAPFGVFDDDINFEKNKSKSEIFYSLPKYLEEKTIKPEETYSLLFEIPPVPWGKLFRKSYIEENNLCFIEDLSFESNIFLIEAILNAKKIITYSKTAMYHKISPRADIDKLDLFEVYRIELNLLKKYNLPRKVINDFQKYKKKSLINYFQTIQDKKVKCKYEKMLKSTYPQFYFITIK